MVLGLIAIIGTYAAGIIILHWLHNRWRSKEPGQVTHIVLIARNNQTQVEWYLRSLYFFSWLKGRVINVTMVDDDSTDDTMHIAVRLSQQQQLSISRAAEWDWDRWILSHQDEQVVVVRLNQHEDLETAFKLL